MEEETEVEKPEEEEVSPIDKANEAAMKLEKANAKMAELLKEQEKRKVEEILAGKSDAGDETKSKEDEEDEMARNMLKGTGFEEQLFPVKKDDNQKRM